MKFYVVKDKEIIEEHDYNNNDELEEIEQYIPYNMIIRGGGTSIKAYIERMYKMFEENNINLESVVLCDSTLGEDDNYTGLIYIPLCGFIKLIKFYQNPYKRYEQYLEVFSFLPDITKREVCKTLFKRYIDYDKLDYKIDYQKKMLTISYKMKFDIDRE